MIISHKRKNKKDSFVFFTKLPPETQKREIEKSISLLSPLETDIRF
jgi:hypothetical protein